MESHHFKKLSLIKINCGEHFGNGKLASYMGLGFKTRSFYSLTQVTHFDAVVVRTMQMKLRSPLQQAQWSGLPSQKSLPGQAF